MAASPSALLAPPRARPGRWDVAVAVVATLVLGLPSLPLLPGVVPFDGGGGAALQVLLLLGVTLAVAAMCAATAWRRVAPVAGSVTIYLGALAHVLLGVPLLPVDVLILLALYSVTAHGPVRAHRLAMGGAVLGAAILSVAFTWGSYAPGPQMVTIFLAASGVAAGAWGLGLLRRTGVQDRAAAAEIERLALLDRERRARLAVTDERNRIAREMHDVVAHTLSVVIAQADGGRYAAIQEPQAAERALTTIAEMGRGALADIRRILGVLRDEQDTATALVPQPVDEDLDRLVEQMRDTGMEISVVRLGESRPLPAGAGLMLYRIAQEALTNVLKHAGSGVRVTLLVQWSEAGLVLQVDDDGRGAAARSDGQGHGLVGMRERAAVLGGTVQMGPRPGGGFRVRLELPVRPVGHGSLPDAGAPLPGSVTPGPGGPGADGPGRTWGEAPPSGTPATRGEPPPSGTPATRGEAPASGGPPGPRRPTDPYAPPDPRKATP